jgi:uncharacterized membrane protein YiaA
MSGKTVAGFILLKVGLWTQLLMIGHKSSSIAALVVVAVNLCSNASLKHVGNRTRGLGFGQWHWHSLPPNC